MPALEDTKDSTMKGWQNQLLQQAVKTAKQKRSKEKAERKKQALKNPGRQLARILTKVIQFPGQPPQQPGGGNKSQSSQKKKAKKRKARRRRANRLPGDPSSSPGSSGSDSSGSGSLPAWESGGEEGSSSSDDKKMVAPLKRRSQKKPGSVLQMLLDHARSQLDQSAKVGYNQGEELAITKGVKIGSYFAVVVRPQLGQSMGQAREMHHLGQCIDLLRQGDLDLLGDALASRFMAIHQAALDGSWVTARHLEVHPLEEGSAAGPEVVLQAKRHARLAAKVAPGDQTHWTQQSKGRGGRGRGAPWQEQPSEAKGKGKKGAKGKGKKQRMAHQCRQGDRRQGEGEDSREVAASEAAPTPLALAEREYDNDGPPSHGCRVGLLKQLVSLCTTYSRTGCALAWLVIAVHNGLVVDESVQEFSHMWMHEIAKNKLAQHSRKGATFPIREGELCRLTSTFKTLALTQVVVEPVLKQWSEKAWVFLTCCALNRLAGMSAVPEVGGWSSSERTAAESIGSAVQRRSDPDVAAPVTEETWQKELNSRRVGYSGEEISICHELSWEQVCPALPPPEHGGCIDSLLWVGPRTREFLLNPEWLLKQPEEVVLPRMPGKVHMVEADRVKIAHELVRRNVCDWIPVDKVYKLGGVPVLNGLFGVTKPGMIEDGRPVLRFIMNLTGSNACQIQLEGGCSSLPSITSWQSLVVDKDEVVKIHQSDMSSAFYLFKLPAQWKPYLAFNLCLPGSEMGGIPSVTYALACNVIPMGWLNSVGIMQEISEGLLSALQSTGRNQISRGRLLPPWMNEILDRSLDENRSWWHIYLDNYAGGERVLPAEDATGAQYFHDSAEEAWREAGVVSSAKKRVQAATRATELGAEINGENHTSGLSTVKLVKLIQYTLWLVSQPRMQRKFVQIIAGRWVFALQFRRPSMSFLQRTWKFINGSGPVTKDLRMKVKAELLSLVFAAPLHHCFVGAEICPQIVCTDASSTGGSVEVSNQLTLEGCSFVKGSQLLEKSRTSAIVPILLVSLFNGIGGAFRSYDILNISPAGRIAVDLDDAANRITQRRWPGTLLFKDVRAITRQVVQQWSVKFLNISEIHLWAGWPCVDLSSVRHGRLNLQGPQSSLFWEIPRVKQLLEEEFGPTVTVKYVLENVASMDMSAAEEISAEIGSWPYKLDCMDAVPMRRPRFAWTSEDIQDTFSDVSIEPKRYWYEVSARAAYPATECWLTPGYAWDGEHEQAVFPTCMKSLPRTAPPTKPAGLEKCSAGAIARWREDQFRYPPYQYERRFLITSSDSWRLLNATEKELLLGYGFNHTILAWSASKQKSNRLGFSDCRHRLLGDSFSVYSFVILAAACCKQFLPLLSYQHVALRMGLAPGHSAILRQHVPLQRSLGYGTFQHKQDDFILGVDLLNRMLLRRTNHTGSDVRILTGEIFNSKVFPRQSVSANWWAWRPAFRTRWKHKAHINVLELEAVLLGIKFQISRLKAYNQRIFQLTDSYVSLSVAAKGRSSSSQLTRVLNTISAHLLAHGLHLVMGHIESAENPSDHGSRA